MRNINKILALVAGLISVSAQAVECTPASWQITGAIPSSLYTGSVPSLPGPIAATGCVGVNAGNEEAGGTYSPSPNLGYLNDGLLNGQGGFVSPTQFISSSQLMDLRTPGVVEDPGWIMLGDLGGNSGTLQTRQVTPSGGAAFDIGSVVRYTQTETSNGVGTWLLEVDKDIVQILNAAGLFQRSFFDHLAFSVKAGNFWAIYDFDFNIINTATGGAFSLDRPYTIAGTWTTICDFCNDRGNPQDISHMSVWVRDPITPNRVPLPGTLLLVGLGLLVLAFSKKRGR